jgi:hypothetical protein
MLMEIMSKSPDGSNVWFEVERRPDCAAASDIATLSSLRAGVWRGRREGRVKKACKRREGVSAGNLERQAAAGIKLRQDRLAFGKWSNAIVQKRRGP